MASEASRRANRKYSELNKEKLKQRNLQFRLDNPEKTILQGAKGRAKKHGIEFNLETSDIIIPKVCPILNIPLQRAVGKGCKLDNSPSLDRIDPTKGYVKGNVWVISQKANAMKSNASKEELIKFANWVFSEKDTSNW
jgi:hypothetical protein